MDVHCSTCGEPWDIYHLQHDAVWETSIPQGDDEYQKYLVDKWKGLSTDKKLTPEYREAFKESGYEFGNSMVNLVHCPSCPKDAKRDPDAEALRSEIENLLGDDTDGIASSFEDFGL